VTLPSALFLLLAAAVPPQTVGVEDDRRIGEPEAPLTLADTISGEDFLLIDAARNHPEMRRADLTCYTIHMGNFRGQRSVTFMSPSRLTTRPVPGKPDTIELVLPPADPACRDTTFVMNGRREVVKVYHDLEEVMEMIYDEDHAPAPAAPRK